MEIVLKMSKQIGPYSSCFVAPMYVWQMPTDY